MAISEKKHSTIVALLLAGTFIAILNQTLMITAIPPIMDEMNVTANSAQWLTTVFMLVNGIMIPISAFLLERFTTRQLFISAMSIFAFGTLVGGFAPNFEFLLLGRVIQSRMLNFHWRKRYGLIKKERTSFCHCLRVALALNSPITMVCPADA